MSMNKVVIGDMSVVTEEHFVVVYVDDDIVLCIPRKADEGLKDLAKALMDAVTYNQIC